MRFQEDREQVLDLVTATPTKTRVKKIINLWNENGVNGIDKPQTLMWGIERKDGGRGVGFTGGHYHRNWAVDGFRQIVLNSIVWVAGAEVPEGGVKSLAVTEDELNENLDVYEGKKNRRIKIPVAEKFMGLPPANFVAAAERLERKKKRAAQQRKKKKMKEEKSKQEKLQKAG